MDENLKKLSAYISDRADLLQVIDLRRAKGAIKIERMESMLLAERTRLSIWFFYSDEDLMKVLYKLSESISAMTDSISINELKELLP
jgi:hypothetical protein